VRFNPPADASQSGWLYLEAQSGRVADVLEPGLIVQQRDAAGAWQDVSRVLPRDRFSTHVVAGLTSDEVRLVFVGNHAITALGRIHPTGTPSLQRLDVASVVHSRLGALGPEFLSASGAGMTLAARDTVELAFEPPTQSTSDTRDWFIVLTGASTSGGVVASRALPAPSDFPDRLMLGTPRPNPFARNTQLRLGLPQSANVRVEVFDLAGRRVATLADGRMSAGWHNVQWGGADRSGGKVAAGIYLCRIVAGRERAERKMVVMP
jgi:hypothetical protein